MSDRRKRLAALAGEANRSGNLADFLMVNVATDNLVIPPCYPYDLARYGWIDKMFWDVTREIMEVIEHAYGGDENRYLTLFGQNVKLARCDIDIGVRKTDGTTWKMYLGSMWTYGRRMIFKKGSSETTYNKRLKAYESYGFKHCMYAPPLLVEHLTYDERWTFLQRKDLTEDLRNRLDRVLEMEEVNVVGDQEDLDMVPLIERERTVVISDLDRILNEIMDEDSE